MNLASSGHKADSTCEIPATDHTRHSILVMDDEKVIRDLAASMLECLGYIASTCANGEEAIESYRIAKESGNPYLAVIMDLTVFGGMGGKDAAKHILLIDPNARLIVSSGYSDDPVMADHKSFGFLLALPKPYKVSDMAKVLAALHSLCPAHTTAPLPSVVIHGAAYADHVLCCSIPSWDKDCLLEFQTLPPT